MSAPNDDRLSVLPVPSTRYQIVERIGQPFADWLPSVSQYVVTWRVSGSPPWMVAPAFVPTA